MLRIFRCIGLISDMPVQIQYSRLKMLRIFRCIGLIQYRNIQHSCLTSKLDVSCAVYSCAVLNLKCHISFKTYDLFYGFFYGMITA